ncbi:Transcriptional regulator, MarR family (plasmid) [Roseomonas mucosa]|jgi:DNA-binding MarR family transcriptional regulator|uniref:MarR family winged helix-turn-helix transcriptional regulator n=1 Tax=Roseomonas TaxID=125216 RepID=UPI0009627C81|nr:MULTISPECIES: MarR family transcriptional regulator [Roseomonas]MDT8265486.1 MarR family transcriptional regulator [Roseomonas sp. DSM 102946]ATR18899.1 MarR family transcriptional regulator [Roseomonas sp. FDAARGOS_362]USQ73767.1 MarR family transcriptional regulator [Roseomonas mucosa]UZO99211.1 Transcriptional regulator, MarR family [Roseomonas mucosa]GAV32475.1 MarR family protein [Roseomonas sp. TAS13]
MAHGSKNGPVLDLENYLPFFITGLSNSLATGASRTYREHFGIGVAEWRLMTMLAQGDGLTLQIVADATGVDKSAISRAENVLFQAGYTRSEPDETDPRRKLIWLTPAGRALHDRVLKVALAREALLMKGVNAEERRLLLQLLRRLMTNVPAVNAYEPEAPAPHKRP